MYNSSHIDAALVAGFKRMVYEWFHLEELKPLERLALAAALEEVAVEIRQVSAAQASAVDEAAKNQIS